MIFFLYLLMITMLSLIPPGALPLTGSDLFPHADKVVHFGMYSILAFLFFYTWPVKFSGKYRQFIPLLLVFVWGSSMEILQLIGGYGRSFSYLDIAANTFGFFPAWLAWKFINMRKYQESI